MTRRFQLAVLALLSFVAVLGFQAVPAFAAGPCDQTVNDGAQVFKGDQSVAAAAQKLDQVGADVRVLTLKDLGGSSTLDDYIKSQQNSCGSWKGSDGHRKNNLLVFAMALKEHKVGIYYGDRWVAAFDQGGGDLRIQSDFMGPQFRNGNFAGGFADGMNESYRVINSFLHPNKGGSGPVPVVVGIIIGAILFIFLLVFGVRYMRQRADEEEKRKTMRARALRARDAASQILQDLDGRSPARKARVAKYSQVGGKQAEQLAASLQTVESSYGSATSGMASAAPAGQGADSPNMTAGEYEQLAERYEAVLAQAQQAQKAAQVIDDVSSAIEAEHQGMSENIPKVQAAVSQLTESTQALRTEGIKLDDVDAHAAAATNALSKAQEKAADLTALTYFEQAQTELQKCRDALSGLTQKRDKLTQGIPALQARITEVGGQMDGAKKCFERISGTYAESSWKSVQGNGTEAEKRINAAGEKLAEATQLSGVHDQQWDEALQSMQEGNQLLDKAASLLVSITELETHLHTAEKQAPQEVADAKADIDKAETYLHTYEADIRKELEKDLADARQLLKEAGDELALPKPDYLKVVALATQANAASDQIYEEAVSEHEAAERLKRQAASTLTQAQAAISQAEQFIEDHSSDISGSAENDLAGAKNELQLAQNAKDSQTILDHAANALEEAEQAYNSAEDDFKEEERRRRRRREEEEAATAAAYSASHSSYSSGSDSFGSSSSWGGGGDGGGSSISFGGGGDGGGSSSGW